MAAGDEKYLLATAAVFLIFGIAAKIIHYYTF